MSANNWSVCPRCKDNARQEVEEAKALLLKDYGKVPVEEFNDRQNAVLEAELALQESDALTFREDYEWYGAHKGLIQGSYQGHCGTCGLSVKVKIEKPFYPEPEPTEATE